MGGSDSVALQTSAALSCREAGAAQGVLREFLGIFAAPGLWNGQGKGRAGQWPQELWDGDVTAEQGTREGVTEQGEAVGALPSNSYNNENHQGSCAGLEQLQQPMANRLSQQGHSVGHSPSSFQGLLWDIFHPHRQKHGDPSWVGAAAPKSPLLSPPLSPQCCCSCPALSCTGIYGTPGFAQAFGISHPSKCPAPL